MGSWCRADRRRRHSPSSWRPGLLVRGDRRVLLQRRGDDGTWGLPGGGLHPGETLEMAARRELLEETGLVADGLRLVDVYSGPEFVVSYPDGFTAYIVGATFETDGYTGALSEDGIETIGLRWCDEGDHTVTINDYNRRLLARAGLSFGRDPQEPRS